MSWKNSLLYFAFQSVKYCGDTAYFKKVWKSYSRLKSSWKPERNSVVDESAWLTFEAIDFLDDYLKPDQKVFEYGGGGSTLFFCKRAGFVVTVENHEAWYKILSDKIKEKAYLNWEGHFEPGIALDSVQSRNPSEPKDYMSGVKGFENLSFERYANAISKFPNETFDLVLVDGRARPSCAAAAIPKLKPGGILILDNAERIYYTKILQPILDQHFDIQLNRFFPTIYVPDFYKTLVLKKKHV